MGMMFEFREPLVDRWLGWLKATGASDVTIRTYRGELRRLQTWAGGPILYLDHDQLTTWQIERAQVIGVASLRGSMSAHRSFYRWALDERLITDDPTRRLKMPRAPRRLPRPMDERDVASALENGGVQEAAIIALAGFAGLRACEVARLDWSEVRLDGHEPLLRVVRGKGGHERIVDVCDELARYLRALPGPQRGPVIRRVDGRSGHVSPARISQMANRHLHQLGIAGTLHTLRHRFGTRVYDESGGDLRATQEALGHQSPTSTAIYTKVSRRNIRAAVVAAGRLDTGGNAA